MLLTCQELPTRLLHLYTGIFVDKQYQGMTLVIIFNYSSVDLLCDTPRQIVYLISLTMKANRQKCLTKGSSEYLFISPYESSSNICLVLR